MSGENPWHWDETVEESCTREAESGGCLSLWLGLL